MKWTIAIVAMAIGVTGLCHAADPQARRDLCFAVDGMSPEQKLESSTAVIQSAGRTRQTLALAYVNRGSAETFSMIDGRMVEATMPAVSAERYIGSITLNGPAAASVARLPNDPGDSQQKTFGGFGRLGDLDGRLGLSFRVCSMGLSWARHPHMNASLDGVAA